MTITTTYATTTITMEMSLQIDNLVSVLCFPVLYIPLPCLLVIIICTLALFTCNICTFNLFTCII